MYKLFSTKWNSVPCRLPTIFIVINVLKMPIRLQPTPMATYEVLMAQLDRYGEKLENNIDFLSKFSTQNKNVDFAGFIIYDDKGVEVFNFGKNKGVPVEKVLKEQQGYYDWMIKSDFPLYTKKVLTKIKLRSSGLVKGV